MRRGTLIEVVSTSAAGALIVVALLACKANKKDDDTAAAATADTASAAPSASVASDPPDTAPPPKPSAKPKSACQGLMISKRCARECTKDEDCPDPKEQCAVFNGFDDDGQNVMGAMVCLYDKDNEPRAVGGDQRPDTVKPTVKVAGDDPSCPGDYSGPMMDNKCHKPCKADKDCHKPNVCTTTPVNTKICDINEAP